MQIRGKTLSNGMAWISNILVFHIFIKKQRSLVFIVNSKNSGIIGVYDRSVSDTTQIENDFNRFKKVCFSNKTFLFIEIIESDGWKSDGLQNFYFQCSRERKFKIWTRPLYHHDS